MIVVFGFPYSPDYVNKDRWATIVFALFPWSLLVKATSDLGRAVIPGNPGIHWQSRSSYVLLPIILGTLSALSAEHTHISKAIMLRV